MSSLAAPGNVRWNASVLVLVGAVDWSVLPDSCDLAVVDYECCLCYADYWSAELVAGAESADDCAWVDDPVELPWSACTET